MVLRNKDGSIYKLQAPNPIMKNQKTWDDFKLHNMKWTTQEVEDTSEKINPISSDFEVKDDFFVALDKAKEEVSQIKEKIKEEVTQKPVEKKEDIVKTFIYCLPAKIREKIDSLYGDVHKTIQYGNPSSFEGVILNQTDLTIEIWTDTNKFDIGSILFPQCQDKRWWRIQDKNPKVNGWILIATPSDYQPSFEN